MEDRNDRNVRQQYTDVHFGRLGGACRHNEKLSRGVPLPGDAEALRILLRVLYLFAHLLYEDLHVHRRAGRLQVLRFG
jgi:hypothetical protein